MAEAKARNKRRRSNFILMMVSAFLAIVAWVILSITNFSEAQVVLHDVPIDFSLEGSYANLASLDVISSDIDSVSVSFDGLRYLLSDYDNSDVHVGLDLNNVRASGSYDIPLVVTSSRDDVKNIQVAPETVHIDFDRLATKTLSVDANSLIVNLSNISAATGYVIDPNEVVITPASVTISGPQDYIDQVTSCELSFSSAKSLSNTDNLTPDVVKLYNGNAVFDNPRVSLDTSNFNVYVPAYITKTLKLEVGLMGYTDQIDTSLIKYTLSTDSITVRSQNSNIENIESINLGYIDIAKIVPGYVQSFQIPQSSYYTNISGIDTVNVSFDLEGYSTSMFTLSNSQIHLINKPAGYDVTVETDRITVTVVGPSEVLDALDSTNFVAQIDLLSYEVSALTRFLTAYVYAPDHPDVWATGTPQVYASYEPIRTDTDDE